MNNFSKHNDSKKSVTILILFIVILLSNVSAFSQTSENNSVAANSNEVNSDAKEESTSTSNMDFVLWFMGSKQDPNSTISTEGINTKKKIMTSGLAPNRLLIKAFLKKAVNFESSLA